MLTAISSAQTYACCKYSSAATSRGASAGLPVALAKCAEKDRSISDQSIASPSSTSSCLGSWCSAKGKRNISPDWGVCGFGPIKTLAQFARNRIYYLKILQIARHLFDWKSAWMDGLRVIQDGLINQGLSFQSIDLTRFVQLAQPCNRIKATPFWWTASSSDPVTRQAQKQELHSQRDVKFHTNRRRTFPAAVDPSPQFQYCAHTILLVITVIHI
jgi:hypothetical protein